MIKILIVLSSLLGAVAAKARPECYVFKGEGLPRGVHDVYVRADRGPLKGAIFSVIARDSKQHLLAGTDFVCNNSTQGVSFCAQDDDLGSFLISWEGEVSLQTKRMVLVTETNDWLEIKDAKDEIVLIGQKKSCKKGLRVPANQKTVPPKKS